MTFIDLCSNAEGHVDAAQNLARVRFAIEESLAFKVTL